MSPVFNSSLGSEKGILGLCMALGFQDTNTHTHHTHGIRINASSPTWYSFKVIELQITLLSGNCRILNYYRLLGWVKLSLIACSFSRPWSLEKVYLNILNMPYFFFIILLESNTPAIFTKITI